MKFSKIVFAIFSALTVLSSALEEGEEACPNYQGSPDCEACVSADCGYVIDVGDCVKDCSTVMDSDCFSVNATGGEVADICTKAAARKNKTSTGVGGETSTAAPAPAPTSSADSFMTSIVQWTVLVVGVGFVVW